MQFPTLRSRVAALLLVALVGVSSSSQAQSFPQRLAFGIDAGGNKLYGNFTDNQFWFSGDAFLRYNILDWLSAHVAVNGGQLRYKTNEANIVNHPEYFGPLGAGVGTGF